MAGLQRSATSFRRQGSSGLVWDDRFISEELNKAADADAGDHRKPEIRDADNTNNPPGAALRPINTVDRSRSNGGYRIGKVSPALEPPSPKLSAFGCCGAFGKGQGQRRKQGKHRSR
ncbi:MAPK kinase substrate protein [Senna tora]|uniref:MAPK kinase substrate protein n=1 Tax=Senna tora TaxID=362788 RepID=A0A834T0R2_9FABA|nr:MAPK kinase substrate protein [Senna tora]